MMPPRAPAPSRSASAPPTDASCRWRWTTSGAASPSLCAWAPMRWSGPGVCLFVCCVGGVVGVGRSSREAGMQGGSAGVGHSNACPVLVRTGTRQKMAWGTHLGQWTGWPSRKSTHPLSSAPNIPLVVSPRTGRGWGTSRWRLWASANGFSARTRVRCCALFAGLGLNFAQAVGSALGGQGQAASLCLPAAVFQRVHAPLPWFAGALAGFAASTEFTFGSIVQARAPARTPDLFACVPTCPPLARNQLMAFLRPVQPRSLQHPAAARDDLARQRALPLRPPGPLEQAVHHDPRRRVQGDAVRGMLSAAFSRLPCSLADGLPWHRAHTHCSPRHDSPLMPPSVGVRSAFHISEDVFAGYNHTQRSGKVKFKEYIR